MKKTSFKSRFLMKSFSAISVVIAFISFVSFSSSAIADATKESTLLLSPERLSLSTEAPIPLTLNPAGIQPQAVGAGARLAALVQYSGTAYVKNVSSITRRATGIYCIRPSAYAALGDLRYIVPVVSVEWGTSSAYVSDALFVYFMRNRARCYSNEIEVHTWDGNYGNEYRSSGVSFSLIVP